MRRALLMRKRRVSSTEALGVGIIRLPCSATLFVRISRVVAALVLAFCLSYPSAAGIRQVRMPVRDPGPVPEWYEHSIATALRDPTAGVAIAVMALPRAHEALIA